MTQPIDDHGVAVVMPVERADLFGGQLAALAAQVGADPFEVVIVTSLPESSLRDCVASFPLPLVVVEAPTRSGPGAARNLGVGATSAQVVVFCDDDDEVSPGWLASLLAALRYADVAGGSVELARLNSPATRRAYGQPDPQLTERYVSDWLPFAGGGNCAVRRTAFDAVGGFDEDFVTGEDRDLCVRLQLAGHQFAFAPEAVVHRRLRSSTDRIIVQAHRWARGEVLLYRRHRAHGMPPSEGARGWLRLARDLPHLLSSDRRVDWLRRLAERTGRLDGSVRYRTRYL